MLSEEVPPHQSDVELDAITKSQQITTQNPPPQSNHQPTVHEFTVKRRFD